MIRRSGFFRIALDRALAAVLLALLPLAPGPAPRLSPPPPPRFVPIRSDVHVIATWGAGYHGPQTPASASGGPDVSLLSKTAGAASVAADATLHYSVSITNATNVTQTFRLTDTLPASMSYLTGTATGGFIYNAVSTSLTATHTLIPFSGDVITATVPPTYTEISGLPPAQNICLLFTTTCDNRAITLGGAGVAFRYLGVDYTTITLDSNGFVVPGSADPGLGNQNQQLPDQSGPNNVIAPFWDDLTGGDWYFVVEHDSGANVDYLVVEWHNAQKKGVGGTAYSFQVWIQLNVEHITFAYQPLIGSTSTASVGFENSDGTLGKSYVYPGAGSVPGPPAELQIMAIFDTALLGYDVQAQHGLQGCSLITNTVNLSNAPGSVLTSATANTSTFGPCLLMPLVAR
jgi:uncharacterized repeat protein (TIGR01451 family)